MWSKGWHSEGPTVSSFQDCVVPSALCHPFIALAA